jgi:delta(3,5)-delta(2,4)-dienoyl-CoA isomerase
LFRKSLNPPSNMLGLRDSERPVWNSYEDYQCLEVNRLPCFLTHVQLNRPHKRNSINRTLWSELEDCFHKLSSDPECRVVVISGIGKAFSAGIDFSGMHSLAGEGQSSGDKDVARRAWEIRRNAEKDHKMFTNIADCPKPVIAAIHGPCLGAAMGIICAADIRYCTDDAFFSIKELDLGLVDSGGTLQRMPKKTGNGSLFSELAFTARNFSAQEALDIGLVSRVFQCQDEMMQAAYALGEEIGSKSPVAVQGTKVTINYARDHTVQQALDYVTSWNMFQMQSEDTVKAALATASRQKDPPVFSKL